MTFGNRIRRDIRKGLARGGTFERRIGLRSKKRKRTSGLPSSAPVRRPPTRRHVVTRARTLRKARKPAKVGHMIQEKYDDFGTLTKDHAAYICFQKHGSYRRMIRTLAAALVRAMLAKVKIYPAGFDVPIVDGVPGEGNNAAFLKLKFRRIKHGTDPAPAIGNVRELDGSKDDVWENTISLTHASTFNSAVSSVATDMATQLALGYYPVEGWVTPFRGANDDKQWVRIEHLDTAVVKMFVKQTITLQNLTPNVDGTHSTDVTGLNPVAGKIYHFNNFRPLLRDGLLKDDISYVVGGPPYDFTNPGWLQNFNTIGSQGVDNGITYNFSPGATDPLAHIPPARQVFKNCAAVQDIRMSPGGSNKFITTFSINTSIKKFVDKIYFGTDYDRGSYGGASLVGLERTRRQSRLGTAAQEDQVVVAFDREVKMGARVQFKTKHVMLGEYQQTDLGAIS